VNVGTRSTSAPRGSHALDAPFVHRSGSCWVATVPVPGLEALSDEGQLRYSPMQVFEDDRRLGPAHCFHDHIARRGRGRFSHWGGVVYFSTSDNSDPNTNGRSYSFVIGSSDATDAARSVYLDRWYRKRELFHTSAVDLWNLHQEGEWFLAQGGRQTPPPVYCNMIGLTSFCNLKCTICGSQEAIDYEGVPRRSMDREVLTSVAETLFPFVSVVILASLGEPTIYPHFNTLLEKVHEHGCSIKLESNATALTPRMIDLLTSVSGELFFSIDATGALFEEVRRGAKWSEADRNVRRLVSQRDPRLTKINLYPTISRRTLPDMLNVTRWARDVGIEEITFHSYDPTMFAKEERPTEDEYAPEIARIREWLTSQAGKLSDFSVKVNGVEVNPGFDMQYDGTYPLRSLPKNHPISRGEYASHEWRCTVPKQNVDIGPDGQIYPCVWSGVRPQENTMGYATSKEGFAKAWFGERYVELRKSLRTDSTTCPNVAQCESCLKRYE